MTSNSLRKGDTVMILKSSTVMELKSLKRVHSDRTKKCKRST